MGWVELERVAEDEVEAEKELDDVDEVVVGEHIGDERSGEQWTPSEYTEHAEEHEDDGACSDHSVHDHWVLLLVSAHVLYWEHDTDSFVSIHSETDGGLPVLVVDELRISQSLPIFAHLLDGVPHHDCHREDNHAVGEHMSVRKDLDLPNPAHASPEQVEEGRKHPLVDRDLEDLLKDIVEVEDVEVDVGAGEAHLREGKAEADDRFALGAEQLGADVYVAGGVELLSDVQNELGTEDAEEETRDESDHSEAPACLDEISREVQDAGADEPFDQSHERSHWIQQFDLLPGALLEDAPSRVR